MTFHPVVHRPLVSRRVVTTVAVAVAGAVAWAVVGVGVAAATAPPTAPPTAPSTEPPRPRVGVALSGGGARGAAHVGVLRELEAAGVEIEAIAGTSMGAVVGGLYAAGLRLDEIERALVEIDWTALFDDRTAYRDLSFRRKTDRLRYRLGLAVGLGPRGIVVPSGLRSGQKLGVVLGTFLVDAAHDFDALAIPFRAVAADIETGEAVVLGAGDLARAIRASLSIPGVLSPVEIDGRLLVDGGIANNLPVDVVRAMGVDVVVAVDVSEPLYPREKLESFLDVSYQVVSLLTRSTMAARLADADVVIAPRLDDIPSAGFTRIPEIIARGREAVHAHREALASFARSTGPRVVPEDRPVEAPRLAFVELEGVASVDRRRLEKRIASCVGEPLDLGTVRRDVAALFGLGAFEAVRFHVVHRGGATGLVFEVEEKDEGAYELRADLRLRAGDGDTAVGAVLGLNRPRLNRRGGEWRSDLQVGEITGLASELYQPIDFAGRFFVAPILEVDQRRLDLFDAFGTRVAEYEVERRWIGFDLGWQVGRDGELRVGARAGSVETDVATGIASLPVGREDAGGWLGRLRVDTTDSPTVPRRGLAVDGEVFVADESLGGERPYRLARLRLSAFTGGGRHTGWFGVEGGSRLGADPLPAYESLRVGGLFSLGGFAQDRFSGEAAVAGRLGYHWRLTALPPGLGGGVYLGGVLEWGEAWAAREDADLGDLHFGTTVFAAADTLLGPLVLAYGRGDGGNDRLYVTLGRALR